MSAPAMYYSQIILNSEVKTTSVGNKTPTLQRCPFVLLFLCGMFCYHYYSCFVINTSSIVKDIIIIMTVILVNMFIIIAIVVQIWSDSLFFHFTWICIPDISTTLFRIFHLLISFLSQMRMMLISVTHNSEAGNGLWASSKSQSSYFHI